MFARRLITSHSFVLKSVLVGATLGVSAQKFAFQSRCDSQHSEFTNADAIATAIAAKRDPFDIVDEDEELEWDGKGETCSFCKLFLESPCRLNFQRWSKCVDRHKEDGTDYINGCKNYTEVKQTVLYLNCINSAFIYLGVDELHKFSHRLFRSAEHEAGVSGR
jgi:hypothetical protein